MVLVESRSVDIWWNVEVVVEREGRMKMCVCGEFRESGALLMMRWFVIGVAATTQDEDGDAKLPAVNRWQHMSYAITFRLLLVFFR